MTEERRIERAGGRRGGLGRRILLWTALVALGPLLIMAYQGYHCARQAIVESTEQHLLTVLESRRKAIDDRLTRLGDDFHFMALTSCTMGTCGGQGCCSLPVKPGGCCSFLEDLRRREPAYLAIAAYDRDWRPANRTAGGGLPPDAPLPGDFGAALAGAAGTVFSPARREADGRLSGYAGRQVPGPGGEVTGRVVAALDLSRALAPILDDRIGLGRTGRAYLITPAETGPVDAAGVRALPECILGPCAPAETRRPVSEAGAVEPNSESPEGFGPQDERGLVRAADHPQSAEQDPGSAGSSAASQPAIDSAEVEPAAEMPATPPPPAEGETMPILRYRNPEGEPVLGAAAAIPRLGLSLVVEAGEAEAFAWLGVLRTRALVTGLITLLLVLYLSARGARTLSRPLVELARVARRIAGGHHEERVGALEGREAREVGRAFNRMMDELETGHRRLVQAASLAAVGQLSSSIVHEMRNPLSSVKMNLQALRRKVEGDAAHRELAEIALGQTARLERMLSDLLGFGRPLDLHPAPMAFAELARDVQEDLKQEIAGKKASVEVEDRLGDVRLIADREHLRRVLANLLANALQAIGAGGRVCLVAAPVASEASPQPLAAIGHSSAFAAAPNGTARVSLTVADDGPGIPEAAMDQLFQPFFTTREGGTGLGLAYARKVVELHGGTVSAANAPGGGAVFTILLPAGGTAS